MEFPRLVYKDKGPHQRMGGTFDYVSVGDEAQLQTRLSEGWALTMDEATAPAPVAPVASKVPAPDDAVEPTRDEIEQKLDELGVVFDRRLGMKKLRALLDETLKARAATQK